MIDRGQSYIRLGFLIAAHVIVGLALVTAVQRIRPTPTPFEISIYQAFVFSEIMLLGAWIGFTNSPLWTKWLEWILSGIWIANLSQAPSHGIADAAISSFLGAGCMMGIVVLSALSRRQVGSIEWSDDWSFASVLPSSQFSVKGLLGLTTGVAALLAVGGVARRSPTDDMAGFLVEVITYQLSAILVTWFVVWGALGLGQVRWRLPVALAASTLAGLLPPYYLAWPPSTFSIAVITATAVALLTSVSLLVVRAAGYRFVPQLRRRTGILPVT